LRIRLGQGQALDLKGPSGKVVRHVEVSFPTRIDTIELPAGAEGTHTVSFPVRPTRRDDNYIDYGNVDLLGLDHAKLAIAPSTEDGKFCLFGPRLYFMVPEGVEAFSVDVDMQTTWAAYGWFPEVSLFAPDGSVADHGVGPGPVTLTVRPAAEQTGRLWSLGPLGRVSAPKPNATWNKPMRPVDAHFPAWFTLSENLPSFVSTHPDLFFVPGE
jgi:hypothetical protein